MIQKRSKGHKDVKIIKIVRIYYEENFNENPIITKNDKKNSENTYSLEIIEKNVESPRFGEMLKTLNKKERKDISEKLEIKNIEPLNTWYDHTEDFLILPKNKIKDQFTFEEFEKIEKKNRCRLIKYDNAYEEAKNYSNIIKKARKIIKEKKEIIHSKRCKCKECSNKKK